MSEALTCTTIEISRGTTHDGPGLRTTVFLKGCPLRCLWCQNPEGIPFEQGVWWEARKCIGCGECIAACPNGALTLTDDGIIRDQERCTVCGACVEACPAKAMLFTGKEWTLDALLNKVLKDEEYYKAFGGGVTVSGGEPLGNYPFVAALFEKLQARGVHTALDTCGLAPQAALEAVLPFTDHVLFDIKIIDAELHEHFTGHSNARILANLAYVAKTIRNLKGTREIKLWIRTPLIHESTATPENIAAISRYIQETIGDITERWELCAFNSVCVQKYEKLGQTWYYADYPLMGQEFINSLETVALDAGVPADMLVISGLTAKPQAQ